MSKKFKNIDEFFNNKDRDKSKCLNIIDKDFISEKASNISPEIITSYLCEQGFSSMIYVKNKYTSTLKDLDNRMLLKLSNIQPNFNKLCSTIQSQPSH